MKEEFSTVPVPDPTLLTTQQLHREITSVREIIETRLSAMDKAIELVRTVADRQPALIDAAVAKLRELHEEKFDSIQTQFTERDIRTEQTARDSKVAVDAALQAAKEAVGEQNKSSALAIAKSEAATTKQIDQISTIIATVTKGFDDKIDDMKERLTSIEGQKKGFGEGWGYLVGFVGILASIGATVALVISLKH